ANGGAGDRTLAIIREPACSTPPHSYAPFAPPEDRLRSAASSVLLPRRPPRRRRPAAASVSSSPLARTKPHPLAAKRARPRRANILAYTPLYQHHARTAARSPSRESPHARRALVIA